MPFKQACNTSTMITGWYGSAHPKHPTTGSGPPGQAPDFPEHLQDVQGELQDLFLRKVLVGFSWFKYGVGRFSQCLT